ncbi:hypothetical protein LDENG_00020270, partial [Lucifuga dentata]
MRTRCVLPGEHAHRHTHTHTHTSEEQVVVSKRLQNDGSVICYIRKMYTFFTNNLTHHINDCFTH